MEFWILVTFLSKSETATLHSICNTSFNMVVGILNDVFFVLFQIITLSVEQIITLTQRGVIYYEHNVPVTKWIWNIADLVKVLSLHISFLIYLNYLWTVLFSIFLFSVFIFPSSNIAICLRFDSYHIIIKINLNLLPIIFRILFVHRVSGYSYVCDSPSIGVA